MTSDGVKRNSWYFRTNINLSTGMRARIYGVPGVGDYKDLPNSKVGAKTAEQRAIQIALSGKRMTPVPEPLKEVDTIRKYAELFLDVYAASHKPSSQLDKRQRLKAYILPAVGDLRLDALRQEDIDTLVAQLLRRGLDRKTVNNITAVLSSLVKYAVRNKVIGPVDLSFMIKAQESELVAVAAGDIDKLLATVTDPRYRVAILLACDAGLRIGEIRALRWSDVNELARDILISRSYDRTGKLTETKGWECRGVPISDRLWAGFRDLDQIGPLVVARRDGGPLGYDVTREVIRAIYDQAGVVIPPKPWHSLRHAFGTELANANVPVHVIKLLMGHRCVETTLRYMHTDREAKRDAIAALRGSHVAAARSSTK